MGDPVELVRLHLLRIPYLLMPFPYASIASHLSGRILLVYILVGCLCRAFRFMGLVPRYHFVLRTQLSYMIHTCQSTSWKHTEIINKNGETTHQRILHKVCCQERQMAG